MCGRSRRASSLIIIYRSDVRAAMPATCSWCPLDTKWPNWSSFRPGGHDELDHLEHAISRKDPDAIHYHAFLRMRNKLVKEGRQQARSPYSFILPGKVVDIYDPARHPLPVLHVAAMLYRPTQDEVNIDYEIGMRATRQLRPPEINPAWMIKYLRYHIITKPSQLAEAPAASPMEPGPRNGKGPLCLLHQSLARRTRRSTPTTTRGTSMRPRC
jgi:hypothetical protein